MNLRKSVSVPRYVEKINMILTNVYIEVSCLFTEMIGTEKNYIRNSNEFLHFWTIEI